MPVERDLRARFPREMKPGGAARSNALERAAERAFHLCCRMPATFATAECLEKVSRLFPPRVDRDAECVDGACP